MSHPNLVHCKFAFQTENKLYIGLDYVDGSDLYSLLERFGKLSPEHTKFIVAQVILALGEIHRLGFAYRDLKPENILIGKNGYIKLADYGLIKKTQRGKNDMYDFVGSIEYMAPEVICRSGSGQAADWWAVGILIYELLVGITPYEAKNDNAALTAKHILAAKAPARRPKVIPELAYDLVSKLLTKDPSTRFGNNGLEEILAHPWFDSLDLAALLDQRITSPIEVPVDYSGSKTSCDTVW